MAKKKKKKEIKLKSRKRRPRRDGLYEGSTLGRLTNDFYSYNSAPDGVGGISHEILRNRSRALSRNYEMVSGMLMTMTNNVVGTGFKLQSQVKMERRDRLDQDTSDKIEHGWMGWCKPETCHTGGEFSFQEMEWQLWHSLVQDGEVFVRFIYQPMGKGNTPLSLEILEADQLAENYYVPSKGGGNAIAQGVEVNQWGRKVAYWFLRRHPSDWSVQRNGYTREDLVRVPSEDVIHLYRSRRPNQRRGVPWIACSLLNAQHSRKFLEAEVIAARLQAAISVFITQEQTGDDPLSKSEENEPEELQGIEAGAIDYLEPGEMPHFFDPSRPNTDAAHFLAMMDRRMAAGQAISDQSVSRDYSQINYSSARAAFLAEVKTYKVYQNWYTQRFSSMVFCRWLKYAVLAGDVSIPRYESNPHRYESHKFRANGWDWVDPEKQVKAYILALKAGLITREKILAEQGEDIEETMKAIASEQELMNGLGLDFDLSTGNTGPPKEDAAKQLILPRKKTRAY